MKNYFAFLTVFAIGIYVGRLQIQNKLSDIWSKGPKRRPTPTHTYAHYRKYKPDDIVIETRKEAETVLGFLNDRLENYGSVSVADYYDLIGIPSDFLDTRRGWTDLTGASVTRIPYEHRYRIRLPKIEELD